MGSIDIVLPSRDSARIVKHTFDGAIIRSISESCKDFACFFQFFTPKGRLIPKSFVFLQRPYPRPRADG